MKDITLKPDSLRQATASARISMPPECLALINSGEVDKGDPREAARIAAYMAAKRTWELLPHCHPLPLQSCGVEFFSDEGALRIQVEVATVAPTGVEMEALTAASVAALTVYDMLKPHAGTDLLIDDIRLVEKRGGKSDFARTVGPGLRASVITCSDAVASGAKPPAAAEWLGQTLQEAGFEAVAQEVVAADAEAISSAVSAALDADCALVITVAGTGINPGDCTVEAVAPLIDQPMPGIMEAARAFGQARTPHALMSRGVGGRSGRSLLITFPGSRQGARETWLALAPAIAHAIEVIRRTRN